MVTVPGGIFKMGTTDKEATQAIDDCTTRDKAKCTLDMTQDSIPEHDVTLDTFQVEKYTVSYAQYVAYLNTLSTSYKTACEGEPCVALQDSNQFKGSYIKQEGSGLQAHDGVVPHPPGGVRDVVRGGFVL